MRLPCMEEERVEGGSCHSKDPMQQCSWQGKVTAAADAAQALTRFWLPPGRW